MAVMVPFLWLFYLKCYTNWSGECFLITSLRQTPRNRQSGVWRGRLSVSWGLSEVRGLGAHPVATSSVSGDRLGSREFFSALGHFYPPLIGGGNRTEQNLPKSHGLQTVQGLGVLSTWRSEGTASSPADWAARQTGCLCRFRHWGASCPTIMWGFTGHYATLLLGSVSPLQPLTFFYLFGAGTWEPWVLSPWTPRETWLMQPRPEAS